MISTYRKPRFIPNCENVLFISYFNKLKHFALIFALFNYLPQESLQFLANTIKPGIKMSN